MRDSLGILWMSASAFGIGGFLFAANAMNGRRPVAAMIIAVVCLASAFALMLPVIRGAWQ